MPSGFADLAHLHQPPFAHGGSCAMQGWHDSPAVPTNFFDRSLQSSHNQIGVSSEAAWQAQPSTQAQISNIHCNFGSPISDKSLQPEATTFCGSQHAASGSQLQLTHMRSGPYDLGTAAQSLSPYLPTRNFKNMLQELLQRRWPHSWNGQVITYEVWSYTNSIPNNQKSHVRKLDFLIYRT